MTEGVGEGLALPSGGRNGRGPRVDQPAAEQHGPWLAGGGASVLSLVAELLGLVATRGESVSTPWLCRSPRCLSLAGSLPTNASRIESARVSLPPFGGAPVVVPL